MKINIFNLHLVDIFVTDDLLGTGPFNHMNKAEPSDSGVGSLESPKNSAKIESTPKSAESRENSRTAPLTPGPRPPTMQSYHPDLDESSRPSNQDRIYESNRY